MEILRKLKINGVTYVLEDERVDPLMEKIAALEERVAALESGGGGGDVTEWELLEGTSLTDGDVFNEIINATGGDANEIFCYSGIPAGTKLKLVCNYSDNWNNPGDGHNPWSAYSGVPVAFDFASGEELLFEATGEDIVIYTVYGYYGGETSHELYAQKSADSDATLLEFTWVDPYGGDDPLTFNFEEGMTWANFVDSPYNVYGYFMYNEYDGVYATNYGPFGPLPSDIVEAKQYPY